MVEEVDGRTRFIYKRYTLYDLITEFHERIWFFLLNDARQSEILDYETTNNLDIAKDTILPAAYAKIDELMRHPDSGDKYGKKN